MHSILLPLWALVLALPAPAYAQTNDKAYCVELSMLYRRYIQNSPGRQFDVEAVVALDDCRKGNTAAGIPVLENRLRQGRFNLPKDFAP